MGHEKRVGMEDSTHAVSMEQAVDKMALWASVPSGLFLQVPALKQITVGMSVYAC